MKAKLIELAISLFLINVIISINAESRAFDCLDTIEDYIGSDWVKLSMNVSYAESSLDLPGDLNGKLEADGIFYFYNPAENGSGYSRIAKSMKDIAHVSPTLLYVRYYSDVVRAEGGKQVAAFPALEADHDLDIYLANTTNYEWGEALVKIDDLYDGPNTHYLGVRELNLGNEVSFFVDKMIVAQGYPAEFGIEEIKSLCPFKDNPTITTTEGTPVGVCESAGFFPHAGSCSTAYHVCLFDAFGLSTDMLVHCPAPQVYCVETMQCQFPQLCPCDL